MTMVYPVQMLLAGFTLLLAFPSATPSTIASTSKEEIKCNYCAPVPIPSPSPPPPVIECPPPPSPPPLSPPPVPQPPPTVPRPPPPSQSPPPPACPGCFPPCIIICPPPCPGCPPPPCNVCQIPQGPPPPRPQAMDQQPGVMGGAVYSSPNEVVPYFPYSSQNHPSSASESAVSFIHLELKLVVSIIFILLSASFSFFQ